MKPQKIFITITAFFGLLLFLGAFLRVQVIRISSTPEQSERATINRLVFPWNKSTDVPKPLFGEYFITTYSYYGLRKGTEQFFYFKPAAAEPSQNIRPAEVQGASNPTPKTEYKNKTKKK